MCYHGMLQAASSDPAVVKITIRQLAADLKTQRPWRGEELTASQKQSLSEIHDLAFGLMKDASFAADMSTLLEEYKTEDSYPRQELFQAVINGRKYVSADIPFLKNLLIALDEFHFDDYPEHFNRWCTPYTIKRAVAFCLLVPINNGQFDGIPDTQLLDRSTRAWAEKYVP